MIKMLVLVILSFYPKTDGGVERTETVTEVTTVEDAALRIEQYRQWGINRRQEGHVYEVNFSCKTITEIPLPEVVYREAKSNPYKPTR